MARPIKPGIDYFSHDVTMSSSEKIERLEHRFGNDGYAVYCKILEKLYASVGKFNIETDADYELYGAKWHTGADKLKEIVSFMREINLFPQKNFVSLSVRQRISRIQSERLRQRKRKQSTILSTNIFPVDNTAITTDEHRFNTPKVKESKPKESKSNERKENGGESSAHTHSGFYFSLKDFCKEILKDTQYMNFDLRFYYEKVKSWALSTGAVRTDWIATARKFMLDDLQNGKPMRASYQYNQALAGIAAEESKAG